MFYSPFSESVSELLMQGRVSVGLAAQIHFDSGTVYVHSGTGPIVLDGYVYYGMGRLGSVDDAGESHTTSASQLKLTLSGLDVSLLASTLNENCVGREAAIYLLVFNENDQVVANNLLFKGKVSATGATAGDTNALQYTLSNVFEDWQRPWSDRFTDESHKANFPDDRIFRYVAQMAERSIYWGSKKDAPGFTYS
ncbi:hypothetical protein [Limnobaculum xujianqingii]|uniref:hypothetical protein n=1 Tax=Limnobaculum xujianqingii TaxID=2738837 RepID=UPI0011262B4E|nr:hypothetical protein [Limnobaculum xujianqingii]